MIEDVIRFTRATSDLPPYSESWQSVSYAARHEELTSYIFSKKDYYPSPNIILFKEGVFSIKEDTTLDELKELAVLIKRRCFIDCFQISVDRDRHECHMLFDFYDRKACQSFHLHKTYQYRLSVLILDFLDMKPVIPSPSWIRHYLFQQYHDDKSIVSKSIEWLSHAKPSKDIYRMIINSLRHSQKMCEGVVK